MPQTEEAISHARAADVPIVVALNKIDLPGANVQRAYEQLAANGLLPSEWGGDTEVVKTSATTGQGIPELIEILDYQAELLELKADPSASACGIVIESRMDEGLGAVATVLVQDGTLRVGDIVLCGPGYGRMRSFVNDRGEMIQEAGPAMPVIISGLNALPNAGDRFYAVEDLEQARSIAEERQNRVRQEQLASKAPVSLDSMLATIKAAEAKEIRLIIKGDVQGSVETLSGTVTGANTDEVKIRVIHAAVGPISESDVELADASGAVIVGFHVVPDEAARQMAEQRRVEIRLYRVIYELLDDLKKALSGLLEPEIREKLHGHAEVRQVFKVSRVGNICGCMVTDGHIQRGSKIRLIRNGVVITEELAFESLRRVKDDVREVKAGFECGIKLAGYDDVKVGDRLEAYARETIQRTL
jgi:translation initiation factor IF-2